MTPSHFRRLLPITAAASLLIGALTGCHSTEQATTPDPTPPALLSASAAAPAEPASAKGSAQLWSQTCGRCHNARSPDSYNAHDWAVVMTHMRIRGYLTGEEQRAILEFLQR